MDSRKEYLAQWYLDNKKKKLQYQKNYYEENLEDRLTYQREYDKTHVEERMSKLKIAGQGFLDRVGVIHKVFKKWGPLWKQAVDSYQDFKDWAIRDSEYNKLYDAWAASGFEKGLSPVCMRKIKKRGFVVDNLQWKVRSDYSWWSREQELREQIEDEIDAEQRIVNKGTAESQARAKASWAKQKNKRSK